jgi:hypothetical protein
MHSLFQPKHASTGETKDKTTAFVAERKFGGVASSS